MSEEVTVTPSMMLAHLMSDSPRIKNAVLIYETEDEKIHFFRIGGNAWAVGAMALESACITDGYVHLEDETE